MKKILFIIGTLLGISSAWATIITDDFNRADTGLSGNGNGVGADWENSRPTLAQWGIAGNEVVANLPSTAAQTALYNTALETLSGNGTHFTASLDIKALRDNQWGGIAFNYQNPTNFYFFRFKSGYSNYQMYRYVNGANQQMFSSSLSGTFASNTVYTLRVSSSSAYVFNYEIKDGGTVIASGTALDDTSSFSGGYAGILQSTAGSDRFAFDTFRLEVVPEPESTQGFNLFVPDEMVPALQAKVASAEFSAEWANYILRADQLCDPASPYYADPDNVTEGYELKVHTVPRRLIYWMQTLGLAYRLTDDPTYRDHAIQLLLNSAQIITIDSIYMAAAASREGAKGDLMRGLATGYDFFAEELTGLQRAQVLQTAREYLEDFIVEAQNPLTAWRPYHNFTGVCGGAAGLVALQLRDLDPSAASGFLQQTLTIIEDWLAQGFDEQGAYYEGVLYSVYGLETVVLLADVLKRDGGVDLFINPTLQKVGHYYLQSALPGEKKLDARNDSLYQNPGEILLKFASEYNSGPLTWLYETQLSVPQYHTWSPGRSFFLQLLWSDETAPASPETVGTPLSEYFEGRGLCTWRTGWERNEVLFSVEAGKYYLVTHDQADEGHFTLYGYGYKWACDPGYANNNDIEGRAQTLAHNCVLIDGAGQARSGAGIGNTGSILSYTNRSDYGYALADCTDAYRWYYRFNAEDRLVNPDGVVVTNTALYPVDHAYRHTLFIRKTDTTPAYAIVLDNIAKDAVPHDYRWQMLSWPGLEISISNTTAVVSPAGGAAPEKMFVFLDAEAPVTLTQDIYTPIPADNITPSSFPRLKATCQATNPYFAAVMVPTDTSISPNVVFENTPTEKIIHVEWPWKTDRITWQKSSTNQAVQVLSTVQTPSSFMDDFNRPDTALSRTGATVGAGWHSSQTTGGWGLAGQRVEANLVEANSVLYNSVLETISGNGTHFIASLDVEALGAYWGGIAFNYQNPTNFYWLRYKGGFSNYSVVRYVDGSPENLATGEMAGTFATHTAYTLTVVSSNAYEFVYEIKETIGGTVVVSGTTTDSNASFTGGYAGILQSTTGLNRFTFDNFSLAVGPAILPPGYAGWAAGWGGINIGADTNDYDLDGLLNLYEYGLGGDPTNATDQGTAPQFEIVIQGGSNVFSYVHPQLSDPDSGLTYSLALRTNLIAGDWATNTGYTVTGTNLTGETLDFVTNVTDTVEGKKFLRLIIE